MLSSQIMTRCYSLTAEPNFSDHAQRTWFPRCNELSKEACRYLTHIDYLSHLALVAFQPQKMEGVGSARYYRPEGNEFAEAAVVVVDAWQGEGVGSYLMEQLIEAAKKQDIAGFEAFVQNDNHRMIGLIERCGYTLHLGEEDDGVIHLWFRFDERNPYARGSSLTESLLLKES